MLRRMRLVPLLAAVALIAPGCQKREEAPLPPPPPPKPASPWTQADSQQVAEQFLAAAVNSTWSSQFRDRNSRPARIDLGAIEDRSGKEVPIDGLRQALSEALTKGGDKIAPAGDAVDYVLGGALGAQPGTLDGAAVLFFQIDLKLTDAKGETVWPFSVERAVPAP
jgi:hypothetical protein